jgi:hypothetical protein
VEVGADPASGPRMTFGSKWPYTLDIGNCYAETRVVTLPKHSNSLVDHLIGAGAREIRNPEEGTWLSGECATGEYRATIVPVYRLALKGEVGEGRHFIDAVRIKCLVDSPTGPHLMKLDVDADHRSRARFMEVALKNYLEENAANDPWGKALGWLRELRMEPTALELTRFRHVAGSSGATIADFDKLEVAAESKFGKDSLFHVAPADQVAICATGTVTDLHSNLLAMLSNPRIIETHDSKRSFYCRG